jgi:hypothetical protein
LHINLSHSGHFILHEGQTRSPQTLHSSRHPRQVVSSHRRQYEVQSSQKSFSQELHQCVSSAFIV